jgi:hypothetical protein
MKKIFGSPKAPPQPKKSEELKKEVIDLKNSSPVRRGEVIVNPCR